MEILEQLELFTEDEEPTFSHSVVIYRDSGILRIVRSKLHVLGMSQAGIRRLDSVPFPLDDVYPLCPDLLGKCEKRLQDVYIKRPSLLAYCCGAEDSVGKLVLREAQFGELLRRFPHRNVAKYFGCVVEDRRIVGLCWQRYNISLEERVKTLQSVSQAQKCLDGVRKGVEHIHSLGFCHNDIKPSNILFGDEDIPVIIDFDSCRPFGESLDFKGGTTGWCDENSDVSSPENDFYSVRMVEKFILSNVE